MSKPDEKDGLVGAMASLSKVSKKGNENRDKVIFAGVCAICLLIFAVMM